MDLPFPFVLLLAPQLLPLLVVVLLLEHEGHEHRCLGGGLPGQHTFEAKVHACVSQCLEGMNV